MAGKMIGLVTNDKTRASGAPVGDTPMKSRTLRRLIAKQIKKQGRKKSA